MTKRNRERLKFVIIFYPGLAVCVANGNWLATFAWVFGWLYGMEWQRVKTAESLETQKGKNE